MGAKDVRGTKEYLLIYAALINAARYRGTVTYQELAELIGMPTFGSYMGKEIGKYLGAISYDEVSQNRPMLSAIAVKVDGMPSTGFFVLAKELGRLQDESDEAQRAFFLAEQRAIYATWKRTFERLPQHS